MAKPKTYKVKNKETEMTHTVPEGHFSLTDEKTYQIIGKKPPKSDEGSGESGGSGEGNGEGGEGNPAE